MESIEKNYTVPENFNYQKARLLFTENKNTVKIKPKLAPYNKDKIINFFIDLGYSRNYSMFLNTKFTNSIENYNYVNP